MVNHALYSGTLCKPFLVPVGAILAWSATQTAQHTQNTRGSGDTVCFLPSPQPRFHYDVFWQNHGRQNFLPSLRENGTIGESEVSNSSALRQEVRYHNVGGVFDKPPGPPSSDYYLSTTSIFPLPSRQITTMDSGLLKASAAILQPHVSTVHYSRGQHLLRDYHNKPSTCTFI